MATVRELPDENRLESVEGRQPGVERPVRYGQPFFPVVPFGMSIFVLATAIALFILATRSPAPLQNPADPLNHEHVNPRPEWYFLFLFQILKIFQGPFELIGTAVIPGLIGLILLGLPFYDRNWSRRAVRRPLAISLAGLTIILLAVLTYIPIEGTASQQAAAGSVPTTVVAHPTYNQIHAIFAANCGPCHIGGGNTAGFNMDTYANLMKGGATSGGGVVNGAVIKAGDPAASYLYQAVSGTQKVGARMPFGLSPLSKVSIQNIFNWIQDGAKNQ